MRRSALVFGALLLLLFAASLAALAQSSLTFPTPAELQRTVDILAAPQLAGRRSGTPEGERAARHIAGWLASAGLRPGGDGGDFFQWFVLESTMAASPASSLAVGTPSARLALGTDWMPHGGSNVAEVAGEVAFVGYGVTAAGGWDDYAGVDVRGKIALALDGVPPHRPGARTSRLEKLILARERGASALLIASAPLPSARTTGSPVDIVSAALTPAAADAVLAPTGRTVAELAETMARTRAARPFATGVPARLRVDLTPVPVRAPNVLGILPGTDPGLAREAVVIGAHYDHLGAIDGTVHPGADDNASGTAVVLGLARAFAQAGGAPRTLVFAFFGAEELGLLGSGHYVRQPAWPLDRTVAMLNFDMVGRLRDGAVVVGGVDTGHGVRALLGDAAKADELRVELRAGPFAPSDHLRFYEAGTPALFFFTGRHADYHGPGDTANKIDADGIARIAALAARVVSALALVSRPVYVKLDRRQAGAATGAGAAGPVFLGVGVDARPGWDGVPLSHVVPGSAAARAGLREGDVLVRLGGTTVNSFDELRAALGRARPGDSLTIVYLRDRLPQAATARPGAGAVPAPGAEQGR